MLLSDIQVYKMIWKPIFSRLLENTWEGEGTGSEKWKIQYGGVLSAALTHEPHHKKPVFAYAKNKDSDQLRGSRVGDLRLCFPNIDGTILLLPKSESSSLEQSSVAVQPGLY